MKTLLIIFLISIISCSKEDPNRQLTWEEFEAKTKALQNKHSLDDESFYSCAHYVTHYNKSKTKNIKHEICLNISKEYDMLHKKFKGLTYTDYDRMMNDRSCTGGLPNCNEFTEKEIEDKIKAYWKEWKKNPKIKDTIICIYPNCMDGGTYLFSSGDEDNP